MGQPTSSEADGALLRILARLREEGYRFVTPTPATHARVVARRGRQQGETLRDIFGWSLPFERGALPADLRELLDRGGMLSDRDGLQRSLIRVSSLHDDLYLHSAFPTDAQDSVFFGPDSYRFADLVLRELTGNPVRAGASIADIGSGAGVGAIIAAEACSDAHVLATDINPKALRLARINASAAGVVIETMETSGLEGVEGELDLVMLNPPYIIDEQDRAYRDGGGMHGDQMSLDLSRAAMDRLAVGGRVLLYTGSAIVRGEDPLRQALTTEVERRGFRLSYREIDPDVFGEELEKSQYRDVERIAVVQAIVTRAS